MTPSDGELGDEARFVLDALFEEPSLSQRQLARQVGLSVTKAHFVLKRLMEKGLIKIRNMARSEHKLGYLYVLTPKGLDAKARLTYRFMHRMAGEYQEMLERVEARLGVTIDEVREASGGSEVKVVILGEGPLAEVVRDLARVHPLAELVSEPGDAELGIVVDPEAASGDPEGLKLVTLA